MKLINLTKYEQQLRDTNEPIHVEEAKTLHRMRFIMDDEDIIALTWDLVDKGKLPYPNDLIEEV